MKSKLWTKNFILMTAVSFALSISTSMLNSPLPMYAGHLGANNSVAGLITGLFSLSALLFRPLFGKMLDDRGRKTILVTGIILYSVIVLSYNWTTAIAVLLFFRFLNGIGFSAYSTASGTVASDLVPSDRLVEGIGYYGIFQTAAMAIGPSIGLALAAKSSYHSLFLMSFFMGITGLALASFINYEKRDGTQLRTIPEQIKEKRKIDILEKSAIPAAIAVFFVTLTSGAVMTFLPVYAYTRGIESIGIYFTVSAVAVLFTRFFSGKLVDRLGFTKAILAGMTLLAVAMCLLAVSASVAQFVSAAVISGLGTGIIFPILNSFVIRFCPDGRRGAANATYYIAFDIGIGGGSVLGGVISQFAGYSVLYFLCTLFVFISFLIYFFYIRRQMTEANIAVSA